MSFLFRSGATSRGDCSLPICQPGSYLNSTLNECDLCPRGYYQDESQQTGCIECPPDTSTKSEGSANSEECTNRFVLKIILFFITNELQI